MKRPAELGNSRRASQNRKATRAGRRAVRARRHRRGSTRFRALTRQHRRICTVASGTPPAGVKLRLARLPRRSRRRRPPRRARPGGCEPPSGTRLDLRGSIASRVRIFACPGCEPGLVRPHGRASESSRQPAGRRRATGRACTITSRSELS